MLNSLASGISIVTKFQRTQIVESHANHGLFRDARSQRVEAQLLQLWAVVSDESAEVEIHISRPQSPEINGQRLQEGQLEALEVAHHLCIRAANTKEAFFVESLQFKSQTAPPQLFVVAQQLVRTGARGSEASDFEVGEEGED